MIAPVDGRHGQNHEIICLRLALVLLLRCCPLVGLVADLANLDLHSDAVHLELLLPVDQLWISGKMHRSALCVDETRCTLTTSRPASERTDQPAIDPELLELEQRVGRVPDGRLLGKVQQQLCRWCRLWQVHC